MEQRRLLEFRKPRTGELLSFKTRQYYVSEDGMVYDGTNKRYLAQYEKHGYLAVCLKDDKGKWNTCIRVHNLVVSVFQRLLERGEQVHHVDKNPRNNDISNLEIINGGEHQRKHVIENWESGTYEGLSEKFKNIGISRPAKQLAQLDKDGRLIKVWPSVMECHRNGYDHSHVSACCNGKRKFKTHKGFKWMWYEDFLKKQEKEEAQQLELSFSE